MAASYIMNDPKWEVEFNTKTLTEYIKRCGGKDQDVKNLQMFDPTASAGTVV